jgi:hypothetical protein
MQNQNILIYQNEQGNIKVDVKFEDQSLWLSQSQICELYIKISIDSLQVAEPSATYN